MNEFRKLREVAATKRDAAIKAAKNEYSLTVQKIAELESRIGTKRRPRGNARKPTLADLIYSVLPDDRCFTQGLSNVFDGPRLINRPCSL